MSILDLFKIRKSNKINDLVWQAIWNEIGKTSHDPVDREGHLLFIGALLYSIRYQAAIAAGMNATVAKSVALQVINKAGYDKSLEQKVLNLFSEDSGPNAKEFAADLHNQIAFLCKFVKSNGVSPRGEEMAAFLAACPRLRNAMMCS